MMPSNRVIFALLFSLILLSVLFTSSLNYYLLQTSLWYKRESVFWLSHIKPQDVVKVQQQNVIKNVTKGIGLLSNYKDKRKVPVIFKPDVTHKYHRYAIASSYWEQQTNAALNMFCIQRWANSIGITVVEPFVCDSEFKLPPEILHNNTLTATLRLRDYIDLDYWNTQASKSGVPPLETWENFVLHSTKNIVVVIMSHFGAGGTYTDDEIMDHPNCHKVMSSFYKMHSTLFHLLQFQIVRNVCFSFFEHVISVENFNAGLQIENEKDVTVWFTEWRGVENGRISFVGLGYNIFGRTQGGEYNLLSMIHPSDRLLNDSQKYVHQVLGVDFHQYDAVVARHKMVPGHGPEWNVRHFNYCASQLEVHTKSVTNKMSLSIDLGKFGDRVNPHRLDYDSQDNYTGHGVDLFKRYLDIVYGNKSIDSYENDFVRVTNGITDSGYIGSLQRTIALHAKRVFLVGGHSSYLTVITEHFGRKNNSDAVTQICFQI